MEGEFIYIGARGNSVIDYVCVNENTCEVLIDFKIGNKIDSDHMPLVVKIAEKNINKYKNKGKKKELEKKKEFISWSEEDIAVFQNKTKEIKIDYAGESTEYLWKKLKERIGMAVTKRERKIKKIRFGYRRWWDKECRRKKRKVKKTYLSWKNGKSIRENFITEKKEWKSLCNMKEKVFNENEEAALRSIKNESDVWKFLGRNSKKSGSIDSNIDLNEWKKHFINLLEDTEECKKGSSREVETIILEQERITRLEIIQAIKTLRKKKAAGIDEIPNEVWIFGGSGLIDILENLINKIWEGK